MSRVHRNIWTFELDLRSHRPAAKIKAIEKELAEVIMQLGELESIIKFYRSRIKEEK